MTLRSSYSLTKLIADNSMQPYWDWNIKGKERKMYVIFKVLSFSRHWYISSQGSAISVTIPVEEGLFPSGLQYPVSTLIPWNANCIILGCIYCPVQETSFFFLCWPATSTSRKQYFSQKVQFKIVVAYMKTWEMLLGCSPNNVVALRY